MRRWLAGVVLLVAATAAALGGAEPVKYRFSFPHPEHRWMQVEAAFADLDDAPLDLRVSRASPGRYSLHDFAKNVYDVHAYGEDGAELPLEQPDAYGWRVRAHGPRVSVAYKVYGDRIDGTYLAVDATHAHINMPAVIMWARGLDDRPVSVALDAPAGAPWRAATQLHPGASPSEFTAPNLQYLMDSPIEFGPLAMESFTVGARTFRFAAHHTGTPAELQGLVKDVAKVVREEGTIYGEFPPYEPGNYTFLADYLPYANSDGMEHRNSTVMTSMGSIAGSRLDMLATVAHEFFHSWNVERIRPRDLEPFDLERANTSDNLWLAEGFTQYYGPLVLTRAGLVDVKTEAQELTALVAAVVDGTGRLFRTPVEMSRLAPLTDGARPIDRTNWSISVTSYYQVGGALALALDLTLRARTDGRVNLDDFMRAMWRRYGKPGGAREGYVDAPYTLDDAEATLGEVSGDRTFASGFFARYVRGRELPDYAALVAPAGFVVRPAAPGRAWLGDVQLSAAGTGAAVVGLTAPTWPLYAAGLDEDDEIRRLDGARIVSMDDVSAVLRRHKPGDRVPMVFARRGGAVVTAAVTLVEDPRVEVVPVESAGGTLTTAQRAFRERWLGTWK